MGVRIAVNRKKCNLSLLFSMHQLSVKGLTNYLIQNTEPPKVKKIMVPIQRLSEAMNCIKKKKFRVMAHLLALYDSVAYNLILLTQESFLQINIFLALTTHLNLGEAEVFMHTDFPHDENQSNSNFVKFQILSLTCFLVLSNFKYSH